MPITRIPSQLLLLLLTTVLPAQKPGTEARTLVVGDTTRDYLLHIPPGFTKDTKKPVPLVIMLHGRTSNGKAAASSYYGWSKLADKEGFVAVFPTALGTPTSWQPVIGGHETVDTEFLTQLIDALVKELALDKDRVFMTGHSSGGFMSYSFASVHPDLVAAIAPVAGLNIAKLPAGAAVSVISFHGMADNVVAYDEEHGKKAAYRGMPSALDSATAFAKRNGCKEPPTRTELHGGKLLLDTWTDGKDGTCVEFYSLPDGDHGWPQGEVSATALIWQFFQQHARTPKPAASDAKK